MGNLYDEKFYDLKLEQYAQSFHKSKLIKRGLISNQGKPKYVIYLRRSTKGKDKQKTSIPDQKKHCLKYAKENKLDWVEILIEKETAYKSNKRDVFYEMLDKIEKGVYNSILAWHPDRLARNMRDAGQIIDMLDRGIIYNLQFPSYTFVNDPNGKMALGIQFVMAKQYSDGLSVSTKRGNEDKLEEGKYIGKGKNGYVVDANKKFKKDPKWFNVIRKAWDLALEGKTYDEIKDYLVSTGIKDKIHKNYLSNTFKDPFYAGFYSVGQSIHDMTKIDPEFTPMVTPKEFIVLRQMLKGRKAFNRVHAETVLFKKMVYCDYCKNLMTPGKSKSSRGKRYLYLSCSNKQCERRKQKKAKNNIRGKVIMDFVLDLLKQGIKVDKKLYKEAIEFHKEQQSSEVKEMHLILRRLKKDKKELEDKRISITKQITYLEDKSIEKVLIQESNDLVAQLLAKQNTIEEQENKIQEAEALIQSEIVSYSDFLNFFENIDEVIKSVNDVYTLDSILRLLFLNFSLGAENVVKYELSEPFKTYFKAFVQDGVEDGT